MNVNMNTVKNILLPLGIMWTVCPLAVVGMIYVSDRFGGASVLIILFALGILSLFSLLIIAMWEKAKARAALKTSEQKVEALEKILEPIKLPPRP